MDLSIIIVTFNSESVISRCLKSILDFTIGINYEIIVVDNSSTDGTLDEIKKFKNKKVNLIKSPNKGFNYGNNRGIEVSSGRYICLLNPDTILVNNAFKIMLDEMDCNPKIGLCGGQLLDENMNKNLTFGTFPSIKSSLLRALEIRSIKYFKGKNRKKYKVDYPVGADFLFRKVIINEIGYLDENYFLYFDETDFAYRIRKNGYDSYIFSDARIIHLEGQSTKEMSEFSEQKFLESYIYYNNKFLSEFQSKIISLINISYNYCLFGVKKYSRKGNYKYNYKQINFYKTVLRSIGKKG